jgi:carboxymethylenebutenolidase
VVIVVHENRGLNPYIEDVARRLAVADFIAFAPDALTSLGGYPGDDEKGLALFGQLDRAKMTEDFVAAATWLRARPDSTGKLGAVGFCFGGGVVNQLAVRMGSDLAAGVPFYGTQPSAAEALKIKAPINAQYAELDKRITDGWPAFDAALTEAQVPHEGHIYRGAKSRFSQRYAPPLRRSRRKGVLAKHAGLVQQVFALSAFKTRRPPVPMNSTIGPRRSLKAPRTLVNQAGRARFPA